jgi:hypothetical protein
VEGADRELSGTNRRVRRDAPVKSAHGRSRARVDAFPQRASRAPFSHARSAPWTRNRPQLAVLTLSAMGCTHMDQR